MPAYLGFIAHPAERHADELAVGGTGYGLPQGGLADAGRAYQAKHWALDLLDSLLHGEIFKDAVFYFLQAVVIRFQHFLRCFDVRAEFGALLPRRVEHPVNVAAHHRRLGRHGRHHLELVQLGGGFVPRFLGHAGGGQALQEGFYLVRDIVHLAEFFLNRLYLFIQVVLPLALFHLLFDPATDSLFHLDQLQLAFQQRQYVVYPIAQINHLQQLLLDLQLQVQLGGNGICQAGWIFNAAKGAHHLWRHLFALRAILLEGAHQGAGQGLAFALADDWLFKQFGLAEEEVVAFLNALDAGPVAALHQDLDGLVWQANQLQQGRQGAEVIQVAWPWVVVVRLALGYQQDALVLTLGKIQRLD